MIHVSMVVNKALLAEVEIQSINASSFADSFCPKGQHFAVLMIHLYQSWEWPFLNLLERKRLQHMWNLESRRMLTLSSYIYLHKTGWTSLDTTKENREPSMQRQFKSLLQCHNFVHTQTAFLVSLEEMNTKPSISAGSNKWNSPPDLLRTQTSQKTAPHTNVVNRS